VKSHSLLTSAFTELVYLEAYERCNVTTIRHFSTRGILDDEIKRQLSLIELPSPDQQAYLDYHMDEIAERIRETWIHKYTCRFDDINGGEPICHPTSLVWKANNYVKPGGIKREADGSASHTSTAATQRPTALASMPTNHWPLALPTTDVKPLKAPAVRSQLPTEPANIPTSQQPLALSTADDNGFTAPTVRVARPTVPASISISMLMDYPHVFDPSSRCLQSDQRFQIIPPKPQFPFIGPRPAPQFGTTVRNPQSSYTGRRPRWQPRYTGFSGRSVPFRPLFSPGFDPDLSPEFRRIYPTFDNIHTEMKRFLVEILQDEMPRETVARCMEALFRGKDDLDEAKEWLSRTFETQGKPAIFLSVSDGEGEDEGQYGAQGKDVGVWEGEEAAFWEEPDHGRAKKKRKVSAALPFPHCSSNQQQRVYIDLTGESDYELEEGEIREYGVLKKEDVEDESDDE
jgi:hypothetical protein